MDLRTQVLPGQRCALARDHPGFGLKMVTECHVRAHRVLLTSGKGPLHTTTLWFSRIQELPIIEPCISFPQMASHQSIFVVQLQHSSLQDVPLPERGPGRLALNGGAGRSASLSGEGQALVSIFHRSFSRSSCQLFQLFQLFQLSHLQVVERCCGDERPHISEREAYVRS
jgi:hypothetical protein